MYIGWYRLTQEETKLFSARYECQVQIRVLDYSNNALASDISDINIHDVLNDEVLTNAH